MKQLFQNMKNGETRIKDLPIPKPGKGCALVQTAYSLVSAGTEKTLVEFSEKNLAQKAISRPDLVRQVLNKAKREGVLNSVQAAFNRLDQPMFPGYSSAGTITALGEGMQGFKVGDRVACGGGNHAVHAEYEVVPRNLLVKLPDNVSFEEAAFATLGSVAIHGLRLAAPQLNDTVLVIGLGLLGLMEVQIAKAAGCRVMGMDISKPKINLARDLGMEAWSRSDIEERVPQFTKGRGFDHVLICAGSKDNDSIELAGKLCRDRGQVIAIGAVGLEIPRKIYYEKELRVMVSRSYGPGRYDTNYEERGQDYPIGYVRWTEGRNMESFVDLIADGKIDVRPLITHRIPITEGERAYNLITGKTGESFLGVLLQYPQSEEPPVNQAVPVAKAHVKIQPEGTKPNIGVLGAGNYANATFLPVMKETTDRCVLKSIASGSGGNARHSAEKFGFEKVETDGNTILSDPEIADVVLMTPHSLHAAQTITALENGKNVYCEKPAAIDPLSLAKVRKCVSEHPDQLYMVGYNRRFAPLAVDLKNFFADCAEPLSMHYTVNAGFIPGTHWTQDPEVGGGRILGEGCHFVDFLIWMCGSLPVKVNAFCLPDCGRYNEDNVSIQLLFENGSVGTVDYLANGDKSCPKERVEVFGGGRIGILSDYRSLDTWKDGNHKQERSALKQDKGHAASWNAFLDAAHRGREIPISSDEIFGGMMACFGAIESVRQQDMIRIPPVSSLDDLLKEGEK
ncbi:MAG: bi-domain-containing oxidoreductase [Flexilinea sp.]|nr:bi-domain-containing oxidoreductase [Flexilinea sp.]